MDKAAIDKLVRICLYTARLPSPSELTDHIREIMHPAIRDLMTFIIETVKERHAKVLQEQDF